MTTRKSGTRQPDLPDIAARSGGRTPSAVPDIYRKVTLTGATPLEPNRQSRIGAAAPTTSSDASRRMVTKAPEAPPNQRRPAAPEPVQVLTTLAEQGTSAAPPPIPAPGNIPAFAPVSDNRPFDLASAAPTTLAAPERPEANLSSPLSVTRSGPPPGWPQQTHASPIQIGAAASNQLLPIAPIRLQTSSEDQSANGNLGSSPIAPSQKPAFPLRIAGSATPLGDVDQPEPTQTAAEQQQGAFALDSVQLGRWMMDHLERQASRPGTMTTGIDPRMTTHFPGAPTGA